MLTRLRTKVINSRCGMYGIDFLRCIQRIPIVVVFFWRRYWKVFVITCDVGFPDLVPCCSPDSKIIYLVRAGSSNSQKKIYAHSLWA